MRSAVRSRNGHKLNIVEKGGKVTQFGIDEDESIVLCASAYKNFMNEGKCKLSDDTNACFQQASQDGLDEVKAVVTLDSATLSEMYDITSRFVYGIDGLEFDKTNVPPGEKPLVDLPCSGSDNPRSRWVLVNKAERNCVSSLHSTSTAALADALANSNDNNPELRDIHMWDVDELKCHTRDSNAYGMLVYVPSDGQCWQNVHPDCKHRPSLPYVCTYVETPNSLILHFLLLVADPPFLCIPSYSNTLLDASVFDFTRWNSASFSSTGILLYPESTMDVWENLRALPNFATVVGVYVGRLGDQVSSRISGRNRRPCCC